MGLGAAAPFNPMAPLPFNAMPALAYNPEPIPAQSSDYPTFFTDPTHDYWQQAGRTEALK
jgi:hypothetical protein